MPTEQIDLLSVAECEVAIAQLESLAADLRAAVALSQSGKEVWVFRKPSLRTILERIPPFQAELQASFRQFQLGEPYGPETQKGRGAKRKAVAGKTAGKRTAKRKTGKKKS